VSLRNAHQPLTAALPRQVVRYTTTDKKAVLWWVLGLPSAVFLLSSTAPHYAAGVSQETAVGLAVVLMFLGGVQAFRVTIRVLNGDYMQKHQ
jgi:hypothetical protein